MKRPEDILQDYVKNLKLYLSRPTGHDEDMMRPVEEIMEVPEQEADDFRRSIMTYIGSLEWKGKTFDLDSHVSFGQACRLLADPTWCRN